MINQIILFVIIGMVINYVIRKVWVSKYLFGSFWDKFQRKARSLLVRE